MDLKDDINECFNNIMNDLRIYEHSDMKKATILAEERDNVNKLMQVIETYIMVCDIKHKSMLDLNKTK